MPDSTQTPQHRFTQPSRRTLGDRRSHLRQQRRARCWQALMRTIVMAGLATGTLTAATSARWQVSSPSQVDIGGNQLLSDTAIADMLAISYPQPLLKLQPQALEAELLQQGPIAKALVRRRLFPPGLNIHVVERHPVAVALPDPDRPLAAVDPLEPFGQMGLLDESGYWIPYQSFSQVSDTFTLPELQVLGMRASYQSSWPTLYAALQQSPVRVEAVDWRSPDNLILQTELGPVHLGPYSPALAKQLATLDQMRHLNTQISTKKIAFIDLRNPDRPSLQILQAAGDP